MEHTSKILMTNKIKEGTEFHYLLTDAVMYFDFFGSEYIPQEVLIKMKDKFITCNIFTIQENHSVKFSFCFITFIESMITGKTLRLYQFLFS